MNRGKLIINFLITLFCINLSAQNNQFGIWTELNVKKSFDKRWTISAQGEYRTTNGLSQTDRWNFGLNTSYKLTSWLKADAGYLWIQNKNPERTTAKGNIVSSYWLNRHRTNVSLTGSFNRNKFKFSLRERWQYTYRPEKKIAKFDKDGTTPKEDEIIEGKGKNVLRSKLEIGYNLYKKRLVPFIYCEFYTTKEIEKTRLSAGSTYKINKNNSFELSYIYQNHSDDENKGHVLNINYSFKF